MASTNIRLSSDLYAYIFHYFSFFFILFVHCGNRIWNCLELVLDRKREREIYWENVGEQKKKAVANNNIRNMIYESFCSSLLCTHKTYNIHSVPPLIPTICNSIFEFLCQIFSFNMTLTMFGAATFRKLFIHPWMKTSASLRRTKNMTQHRECQ